MVLAEAMIAAVDVIADDSGGVAAADVALTEFVAGCITHVATS